MLKNWKPLIIGKRRWFLMVTIIILGLCFYGAEIRKDKILPSKEGLSLLLDFISAGFQPALDYQSSNLPEDTPPYYQKLLSALLLTLKYAVCAISLSIPIGIIFGFLATHSWWNKLHSSPVKKLFLFPLRYTVKVIITAGRSIHEVIWAILFVAALGSSPIAVIVALAIPYGSTLAKVFSETLDEQDHKNQLILEAHGGGGMKCWFFSTLPSSLPDILSYSFYRFECAVRSAAILGFVGIPTIGYHIQTAMGDYHLNEIWTLLYLLLITVLCIEFLSKVIRNILSSPLTSKSIPKTLNVTTLKKAKKKPWGLYITLLCSSVIIILSWNLGENILSDVPLEKRMKNLNRFIEQDLTPRVVRNSGDWSLYIPWAKEAFFKDGLTGALQTLSIATAAMIIAFWSALILQPFAAKELNTLSPYQVQLGKSPYFIIVRNIFAWFIRVLFTLSRSMPEFLMAFLLVQLLGPTSWPLILGLAIHNFGIIGRLGGEIMDNNPLNETKVLLSQGGIRLQAYGFTLLPAFFNRMLLYFFYRWETCIRDATILGILGATSLGFLIDDSASKDRYDLMIFYVLLGAIIVFIGDIVSSIVRNRLRN